MSRRTAVHAAALAAASVLSLSGCFSYVETSSPTLGSSVRVTVPVRGDAPDGVAVRSFNEGVLVQGAPTFGLQRRNSAPVGQFRETVKLDTIWIPEANVQRLEVRRFSALKTSLGSAALGIAVYGLFQKIHNTDTRCRSCSVS